MSLQCKLEASSSHGDFETCVNLLQTCLTLALLSCQICCKLADLLQTKIAIWDVLYKRNHDPMGQQWLLMVPKELRSELSISVGKSSGSIFSLEFEEESSCNGSYDAEDFEAETFDSPIFFFDNSKSSPFLFVATGVQGGLKTCTALHDELTTTSHATQQLNFRPRNSPQPDIPNTPQSYSISQDRWLSVIVDTTIAFRFSISTVDSP
ncbi:hypothetical protein AVEN_108666-1 [Araneus ventricosus]|uniref:Uncharacterized protein n=1 Tax=Araneus ventricosus TaxID=182803 RepID=A0A4Y2PQ61_ARAVE|nr:hypothetical protein AVEN_108666-1 [Araneus ventricosus]